MTPLPDTALPPTSVDVPRTVDAIDWRRWSPVDHATLTFVVRRAERGRDDVLLIRKKRGLGAGKVNGPGGRLEGDESAADCAVREVEEELHVTPLEPEDRGRLSFQFVDGYSLHVHVYRASAHRGTATETDEAIPLWTPVDRIPYDQMWSDDRLWLPHLLRGARFRGRFVFDGDSMLDHVLEIEDAPGAWPDLEWVDRAPASAVERTEAG